ncbi:tetratricopeptide repeat protein [bacterium]|nr:tetratricopeptide repeat protein [bacterium]
MSYLSQNKYRLRIGKRRHSCRQRRIIPQLRDALPLLLLVIILLTVPQGSHAIDLFGLDDKQNKGLELLPDDLRERWLSIISHADSADVDAYLAEGRKVIDQLEKLIEVIGGEIPQPGAASYPVYVSTMTDLVKLLDRIEMAAVLTMADDEHLNELRRKYRAEREELQVEIRTDRQNLIQKGSERLRVHTRDADYRKHIHKRAVVADLYFRMAELMYQEAEARFGDELETYTNRFNELVETDPAAAVRLPRPQKDFSQVLTMYRRIFDEFNETQYGIDALYNLAFIFSESEDPNDRETANSYFETLIELHPGNRYTLNALRKISDFYFAPVEGDLELATEHTRKAIEAFNRIVNDFPDSDYYIFAMYMLGWSYYKLSDFPNSVESFAKTLDMDYLFDGTLRDKGDENDFTDDATRYLGICFSVKTDEWEGAGVDGLVRWLEEHPERLRDYGATVLDTLADIFTINRGQYFEGVYAYSKFVEMFPLHPKAWEAQRSITEIFLEEKISDPERAFEEVIKLFDTYNPDSEWWAANPDQIIRNPVVPVLEDYLNKIIDEYLNTGWESNDVEKLEKFEHYARQYLRFWPAGPHAYDIHSNLAIVLFEKLNRPAESIREHWQVATAYENREQMEISCNTVVKIAILFAKQELNGEIYISDEGDILSPEMAPPKEEVIAVEDTVKRDPLSLEPDIHRTDLLNSERLELAAFDLYMDNFPDGNLIEIILYRAGEFLYKRDWIEESRYYLERYIREFPEGKNFESAYTSLFDGYFRGIDLGGVEEVAERIMQSPDLSRELKQTVQTNKAIAMFRNAKGLEQVDAPVLAADEYLRVAMQCPNWERADAALYLAGMQYTKGSEFEKSNEAYFKLIENYPRSDLAPTSLYNAAINQQNSLMLFSEAAQTFERLSREYPDAEVIKDALSFASVNFEKAGKARDVIRINEKFLSLYPDHPDADLYLFEMAKHYLSLDDFESANNIYLRFAEKYPNDPRTIQAYFERATYYLGKGNQRKAAAEYRQTVEAHDLQVAEELPGNKNYASRSLAKLLAWEHVEYDKLRFKLPLGNLRASTHRKEEWKNSLTAKYEKLIGLRQNEAWQGFYAIARLWDDQARAIYDQEIPRISKQDSLNTYIDVVVVDSAIITNNYTIDYYKYAYQQLDTARIQLAEAKNAFQAEHDHLITYQREYEEWKLTNSVAVEDTALAAVIDSANTDVLADSSAKLKALIDLLAETDTSITEAEKWAVVCRRRIPELAVLNGDYLVRSFMLRFGKYEPILREKDEEVKLEGRELVIKDQLLPFVPEVCGYYLQAIDPIVETGVDVDQWISRLDSSFSFVVDTLFSQWDEQFETTRKRIDEYAREYDVILPKWEFATSREGFLKEMMGDRILYWIDKLHRFNMEKLSAYEEVLDTVSHYNRPVGFAEESLLRPLEYVLVQYDEYEERFVEAVLKQDEYARTYEENPTWFDREFEEEIDAYWWDDAIIAYEEIEHSYEDYGIGILERGLDIKEKFNLIGLTGIAILRKLVELRPDEYAAKVGIEPQYFVIVSSPEWLIWPIEEDFFTDVDFDDSSWEHAHPSAFPAGSNFTKLDSLSATPIWYQMFAPPAIPEWSEYPMDEVIGIEGELIEFTVVGIAPERGEEDEWGEDEWEEDLVWDEIPEDVITVTEGEPIEFSVSGSDSWESELTLSLFSENLPDVTEFTDNGDNSGSFSWQTKEGDAGSYTMTLELTSDEDFIEREVTLEVLPLKEAQPDTLLAEPDVVEEIPEPEEEKPLAPPAELSIVYSSENIPSEESVFIDEGDGRGTFMWTPSFVAAGEYTATFTLYNFNIPAEMTVFITVENTDRGFAWTAFPDSLDVEEGMVVEFKVAGEDPDGDELFIDYSSEDIPYEAEFIDNGDGTGLFRWETTWEDSGSYTAAFTLTDGENVLDDNVAIHITNAVRMPRLIDVPDSIEEYEGSVIDLIFSGSSPDEEMPVITSRNVGMPEEAVFVDQGDGTATFVWETTYEDSGHYSLHLEISNVDTTVIYDIPIWIKNATRSPRWVDLPDGDVTAEEGSLIEFFVKGEHPDNLELSIIYFSGDLPEVAGFTDNGDGTGSFNWQTAIGDLNTYIASFALSDVETTVVADVQIVIRGATPPPEWIEIPEEVQVEIESIVEFAVKGSDPSGLEVTIEYSSETLPDVVQFADLGDGTGSLSWLTTAEDEGRYSAVFVISNGKTSATAETVIIVGLPTPPPEWTDVPTDVAGDAGSLIEFTVVSIDPSGNAVSIEYTGDLPDIAQFTDNGDGTGSFNWQTSSEDEGSYVASFVLSNGELTASAEVIIVIGAAAQPPEWTELPTDVSGEAGTIIEFTVSGTDPAEQPLTIEYSPGDLPEAALFTDNGDGTGSFNWQTSSEDEGSYVASFVLSNGELTASAEVIIVVGAAAQPPEWTELPTDVSGEAGSIIEFTIAGTDPAGQPLTIEYSPGDLPEAALFTDNGDGTGSFSWQTSSEDEGSYVASFVLSNGMLTASAEVVSVITEKPDQAPVWVDILEFTEVNENETLEFTIVGTDPDDDAVIIEFSSDDIPEAAQFSDNGDGSGTFIWQPTYMDAESYSAGFILRSGELSSEAKTVTIQVNNVDQPPEWILIEETVTGDEGSLIEFEVLGLDADGDEITISFSSDNLPETAVFTDLGEGSGTFSWQTTFDDAGGYSLTLVLHSNDISTEAVISITINDVEQAPEELQPEPEGEDQVNPEGE